MKTIRIILSLFLLALATAIHAESISVSPVTLEPGGIVPIPVNCEFNSEDITLYQFDLYLPNGVTLAKNNKGRYAAGTTYTLSDRHDEHTASLKDNTGFVRFVVSQNDGYLITPGKGLLLTLYVQADANVSGELQASIKNFMMFETNETKHAMSDITFKMTVPAATIPATGISLDKTTATLTSSGQTLQLSATVTPSNATDKTVTWTSSNTAVASVSSTGLVTAVSNGTATITAKTADGSNKTATCTVTVNIPVPATGISLDKTTATLTTQGQTLQLSATVTPSNATNKSVTWTSSNTAVATVSSTGLVTAVSNGSATITAKTADGSNKTATCTVTVNIPVPATGISLNQTSATLTSSGQTVQLTATVTPSNATDKTVTWTSSNTAVATVSSTGLVTAVSNGTATITAKTADGSNKTATCTVTVDIPSVPDAEGISVSPVTLEPGGIVPIPVNCEFSSEDITLYQFDLYLPEGVTLAKNNKGRYAAGTTYVLSDRHDEHTASLKDNTGFVRFVVSQNDGYLITPGKGLLLTLYVQADANVSGELQASIKNFMMFETNETKHAMSDITFKMTVPAADKNIQFADDAVKAICVANWDTNGDGELSEDEATQVKDIGTVFKSNKDITSFDELQYFMGLRSIGNSAFDRCSGLTSITIPNSVTSIGSYAFYNCSGLTSVTIPNSVTSIGREAFYNCSGLTSVTIPNSVTSIGYGAFNSCGGITSIKVDNSNPKYNSRDNCNAIIETSTNTLIAGCQNTVIPISVESIGNCAFYGCGSLTSVTIPNSVKRIGEYAFCRCASLTSITIPSSVESITYGAFAWCRDLTSIKVENGNPNYDSRDNCNAIIETSRNTLVLGCQNTVIPNNVTGIGNDAFSGCTSLASVTIPDKVTSIGGFAFEGCSGLTSVTIPNSVISIGIYAFYGCSGLTEVYCLTQQVPNTYSNAFSNSNIASATLYVPGLYMDDYKSADVWKDFGTILSLDNNFVKDGIYYNINENGTSVSVTYKTEDYNSYSSSVVIPSVVTMNNTEYSVTGIGDKAFYNCTDLTSVTLPNNVTSIGTEAFPANVKIYVDKGVSPLIAAWNYGINPYDVTTNTCLTTPYNYRVSSYASSIRLMNSTPTNLIKIENESLTVNGVTASGKTVSITGLTPNTSYQVQYIANITYGDGTSVYTREDSKSTKALTLTTSLPKVISVGSAVVAATSNLDDEEENVGFEWRRLDWPDEISSNSGIAYLYEGTMEGYIRNLNADKYWKVRPFYKANDGTYYYGEWVGFDPANTSYFEPTVHTYSKIDQTENKVQISGYVQRGTDDVSKQGFKYWIQEDNARGAGVSIPTGAKTVEAEGRVMEVELTGLRPNTTYSYVAFVTTTDGETFYGKQQSFTTGDDPAGIITGDANGNGEVEIGDVTSVLTLMATPEATGYDNKAADANQNGEIEIGDVTTILTIMARGE